MIYAIAVIAVLILDQAVKYWTNLSLAVGESRAFIPGFMELFYTQNDGAAFGLFGGSALARWLFVVLMAVFAIAVIYVLVNDIVKAPLGRWLLVLIMAGGLGNCIDRIINGYVIDMFHFTFKIFGIDFASFAIFNVADIFLTVGGIAFCIWLIFHKPDESEKLERPEPSRYPRNARIKTEPAQNTDYITQLKKPVVKARVELEQPKVENPPPRTRTRAQTPPAAQSEGDPFTDFFTSTSTEKKPTPQASPRQSAPVDPTPAAPAAPTPKKSDDDFSLDDILAEFSDK